jgi:hypothetical protein
MLVAKLGDPVTFYQRNFRNEWWVSTIQSYAQCRAILKGEGLHQHHLIPKSLLLYGPAVTQDLVDYVPSVPLAEAEHLKTLHAALNSLLRERHLWQRRLTGAELREAIELVAQFYDGHGLRHFGAAVRGFRREACDRV